MGLLEDSTPVFLNQHEDEFSMLLDLYIKTQPKVVLEIGTYKGGTLFHWINNAPDGARIGSIDNQHESEDLYQQWANNRVEVDHFFGDSKSYGAINFAAKFYSPVDWLFIDGDHSYKGVKSDWDNYSAFMKPGGIIAFHDILPHPPYEDHPIEVDKFWNEIKEDHSTEEFIGDHEWPYLAGIGVVYL